jgi:A49-like RNA polymerase I associated factor
MAPIKIKVNESSFDEKPILCRLPRNKRNISFLLEGKELKGSDDTCDYQAISSNQSSLFCLATLDTTETEDGYQTLTLRPIDKFYETWETSVRGYEQQLPTVEGARAQYNAMIQDFASLKKQKVVRSREANRLAEGTDKTTAAADPGKLSASEIATNEWRTSFLPKWNVECPEPSKVFEFKDTIGPGLWHWVENLAVNGFSLSNSTSSPSMEQLFKERLGEKYKPTKLQLTCGVLCVFFLNLFIRLNRKKLISHVDSSKTSYAGTPVTIAERFLSRFATPSGSGFVMTKSNRDSCLVHILLLYLTAYHKHAKVDSLRAITTDLMIDGTEAARLLRQAGCKVVRKDNTYAAGIHVPLTFPASKLGRR